MQGVSSITDRGIRAAVLSDDDGLPADWTIRAGLYERVSTLARTERERQQAKSIDQQNADNVEICQLHRWLVVDRFPDPGLSASRFARKARPEHARLLKAIAAGQLDVVVLWEPSRGDRKLTTWSAFLDACRTHGVLIYVTSHRHLYDVRNSRDWRALADDGIDAAMESEKLSARCLRGQRAAASGGRPHGIPNYGYERVYDPLTGGLTGQREKGPTPEDITAGRPGQADVVREIIAKTARGYPRHRLAADLNRRKIPGPGRKLWRAMAIRRIASNPVYIGKRSHNGDLHDAIWPALVEEDVYWAAAAVLASGKHSRPGRLKYLLSYIAVCGECKGLMCVNLQRDCGRPVYCCEAKGCTAIYMDELDTYVELAAWEWLSKPDPFPLTVQATDAETVAARGEAAQLRTRLEEFTSAAAAGDVTPAGFAKIEKELLPKIAAAERRAAALAVPLPLRDLAGQPYKQVRAKWASQPMPARRDICAALFQRIEIKSEPYPAPVPRWNEQKQRWVIRIRHQRKLYHYSSHKDLDEAQAVMDQVRAELAKANPRRPRGTYAITPTRVILELRQPAAESSNTHT